MAGVLLREGITPSDVQVGENFGGTALLGKILPAQTHGFRPGLRRGLVEVKLFWNSWWREARWLVRQPQVV